MQRVESAARARRVVGVVCLGLCLGNGPTVVAAADTGGEAPVLLGELERTQIEAAVPDWVEEQITAAPDAVASAALVDALVGAEVIVYLGTWCSDSRRELARLWRALDEVGITDPPELSYIGVERDPQQRDESLADGQLLFVPTFVVRRDGQELGRIVESAPDGIERDLLALLRGDRKGLVTGRDDLQPTPAPESG